MAGRNSVVNPCAQRGIGFGLRLTAAALIAGAGAGAVAGTLGPPPGMVDVELLAANALIMAGTDMHIVDQAWVQMALNNYIQPTLGGAATGVPVETPSQFWPFTGPQDMVFDLSVQGGTQAIATAIAAHGAADADPLVVFGYSQSSVTATAAKRRLAEATTRGTNTPAVSFVMLANPNRPNGGINSRFTGAVIEQLGWTFSAATPNDTPFSTVDVAKQYDLFADFPRYPLNALATANAIVALLYGSHDYTDVTLDPADPDYNSNTVIQRLGDTTYYFIPTAMLPLLRPLRDLGIDPVLLDAAEPALRLLVEFGYDRTTPFGQSAQAELTQREDFDQLGTDLTAAIDQGRAIVEAAASAQDPPQPAEPSIPRKPSRWTAPASTTVVLPSPAPASQLPPTTDAPVDAPRRAKPIRAGAEQKSAARPEPSAASRSRR